MVYNTADLVVFTAVSLCLAGLIAFTTGDTACVQARDCEECLQADVGCTWCGAVNACALHGDSIKNVESWKDHNCTFTAVNATTGCPPQDFTMLTPLPTTPKRKLKCAAAHAALPEEDCDQSVLDEERDRRGSIMVILPLISALLGVVSFCIMVIVWLKCFYNRKSHRERDSSDGNTTEMTDLAKDELHTRQKAHNGN